MAKRYYWLQMKQDFFKDKRVKKLRKIAGGDTYTIIYLKLMLSSLETEGIITFEGVEKTLAEEVALDLDEDADNVDITISFLLQTGLLIDIGENQYYLPVVAENLGSEGASAKRVREYRARQKALQCNADVTEVKQNSNGEIDIDIEIDKDTTTTTDNNSISISFEKSKNQLVKETTLRGGYNGHVKITNYELNELDSKDGRERVRLMITRLDDYIEQKGRFYENHAQIIEKWINEDDKKRGTG